MMAKEINGLVLTIASKNKFIGGDDFYNEDVVEYDYLDEGNVSDVTHFFNIFEHIRKNNPNYEFSATISVVNIEEWEEHNNTREYNEWDNDKTYLLKEIISLLKKN